MANDAFLGFCCYAYDYIMSNIKYFGFGKQSASVPIFSIVLQQSDAEDIKTEVSKVLSQLRLLGLRIDEKQKIKSHLGSWYTKKDSHGILYYALCSSNYPERHIYSAINQIKSHLEKLGDDFQDEANSTLRLHCESHVEQILKNFQNLKVFDKTTAVKIQIEETRAGAIQNIVKMTDNTAQMEDLSNKTDILKEKSLLFERKADQLQNKMKRRGCKIRVIIGIAAVSFLLLVLIPIITKTVR